MGILDRFKKASVALAGAVSKPTQKVQRFARARNVEYAPTGKGGDYIAKQLQQQFKQAVNQPRRRVVRTRTLRTPQYNQMMAQRMAQVRAARQMPQQQYNNPNLSQQSPYQPQMAQGSPQRAPAYIFRGTGVNPLGTMNGPLPPSNQTLQQGYIIKTDLMSGRRYAVPIKPPERWIAKY